jgi:UDP-glucose 4-epimerase
MNRALITGGAGFIGFHLAAALLTRGSEVHLLDDLSRGQVDQDLANLLQNPACKLLRYDLSDPKTVDALSRDYDIIVHLAAIVGVRHVSERPYDVLCLNVELLRNAIELARRQRRLTRFVFASTSEVYAGTLVHFDMRVPTPEDTPLAIPSVSDRRSTYMLSKIYGEAMCHHAGIPFTIVRPHNVYGPRMGLVHVVPELLKKVHESLDGGALEVRSARHTRVFCYVDDAVDFLLRVLDGDSCRGKTLNLGSTDHEITIQSLADVIVDVVGRKMKVVAADEMQGSPRRRAPDMRAARALTGYESKVDIREGLRKTYEWYRANVFESAKSSII